jgi:hypothetical protein
MTARAGRELRTTAVALPALLSESVPYFGVVGDRNLGDELLTSLAESAVAPRRLLPIGRSGLVERAALQVVRERSPLLVGGGTLLLSPPLKKLLTGLSPSTTCTFGTGVLDDVYWGRLTSREREEWRLLLHGANALGVRGPRSLEILQELGVDHAEIVGDPGFLLCREGLDAPSERQLIGINFGTSLGEVWGRDETQAERDLAAEVRTIRAAGWDVRFFAVWPRDLDSIRRVAALSGVSSPDVVRSYRSPKMFMRLVGECRALLAMKLHAAVLGICAGVPTLAIEYRPKTSDLMRSIGAETDMVRFDSLAHSDLAERIVAMATLPRDVAERQLQGARSMRAAFRTYQRRVVALLERSHQPRGDLVG